MFKYLWPCLFWLPLFSVHNALAQEVLQNDKKKPVKFFDGIYLGLLAGSQNVFGGSWVDGKDILAQESKFVFEIVTGFRKQFLSQRLVIGFEMQFGFSNVNLKHEDPASQLTISYSNSRQHGIGGIAGVAIARQKRALIYVYINETTRDFELLIERPPARFRQQDEQGMLKYGIGVELPVYKWFNIRAAAGCLKVDFGDKITNIDVEDKLDFMAGIVYQPWAKR